MNSLDLKVTRNTDSTDHHMIFRFSEQQGTWSDQDGPEAYISDLWVYRNTQSTWTDQRLQFRFVGNQEHVVNQDGLEAIVQICGYTEIRSQIGRIRDYS